MKKETIILLLAIMLAIASLIYIKVYAKNKQLSGQEAITIKKESPEELIKCSDEIFAGQCDKYPERAVCGYDLTVYPNSKEITHGIDYKNACVYCQMFGKEGVSQLGQVRITALGYEEKSCR